LASKRLTKSTHKYSSSERRTLLWVVAGDLEDGWIGVCSPSGHKACGKTEKKKRGKKCLSRRLQHFLVLARVYLKRFVSCSPRFSAGLAVLPLDLCCN